MDYYSQSQIRLLIEVELLINKQKNFVNKLNFNIHGFENIILIYKQTKYLRLLLSFADVHVNQITQS